MINGLWGKKVGMTEVFKDDLALPVTVVDTSGWFVLQIKTSEGDGYDAIKVGCLRKRHQGKEFDFQWLKNLSKNFQYVRELSVKELSDDVKVGSSADLNKVTFEEGTSVDVVGTSKGCGFAGVIKRHNFSGGPASHGGKSTLRKPGSIGFFTSQGKVIKGKKMAGHMGNTRKTVKGLKVIKVDSDANAVFVKGAIPGKSGSLVFVRKYK